MRRLLIATLIIAGTMVATTGYSQVYINAHVGFGYPVHRVYCAPPPPVVYQEEYPAPPVVYETPAPAPCYGNYNQERVVIVNRGYHGQGYYHDRYDHNRYEDRRDERYRESRHRDHERDYDRRDYDHDRQW
jgi:hypothetical protein